MAWQFERKGVIVVPDEGVDEDELMLAARRRAVPRTSRPGRHLAGHHRADRPGTRCATALEEAGIAVDSAELTMLPKNPVELDDERRRAKLLRVIDALEEHDDVQDVYFNFDIPDAVLESVAG